MNLSHMYLVSDDCHIVILRTVNPIRSVRTLFRHEYSCDTMNRRGREDPHLPALVWSSPEAFSGSTVLIGKEFNSRRLVIRKDKHEVSRGSGLREGTPCLEVQPCV